MARLFADENFPLATVEALRLRGHDVETALDAGRANQRIPDGAVVEYATRCGRAVLTLNRRDFVRLHRHSNAHQGIIACTADRDFEPLAERIDHAVHNIDDLAGQLLRIHRLPLAPAHEAGS